jgi:endoglucanase
MRRSMTAGFAAVLLAVGLAAPAEAATPPARAQLRVDQGGYLSGEAKYAYLMSSTPLAHPSARLVDAGGHTVLTTSAVTATGSWNQAYPDVYRLSFGELRTPGRYRLRSTGPAAASPWFTVSAAPDVYSTMLRDGVSFDQVQRDGANVISGPLHREPAHLNDRRAQVYATPTFNPDSDTINEADLTRISGPVDVSGGWYDAGDYLKLTHSTAYNDILLFASARSLGAQAPSALSTEARYGLQWLGKMWDARHKVLYLQVGVGTGNSAGTFAGDHDLWRLPQEDDRNGDPVDRYASAHRPVFEAAAPGQKISPNLVGRVAAAFALAAQADARTHPDRARYELGQATSLYAMADTSSPPDPLVTALPHDYYPESTWRDDMELGATEIALAAQALHRPAARYLADAQTWARGYLASDTGDTLNLYDTSALAHLDLVRALAADPAAGGITLALLADVRRQLDGGVARAQTDPFGAAGDYDNFDVDSHTFGLIATAGWYRALTGDTSYAGFATEQRGWLLGANAWGSSFMVGLGTTFPHCMQHQVANLSGSTDGRAPLDVGAVVNGPNGAAQFSDGLGGRQDGMVKCPSAGGNRFAAFDGRGSVYVDDVRSWQTDEPALDMTGAAIAAAAAQLSVRQRPALPAHVFAPYFESYQTGDSPAALSAASGAKFLTMAFVETPSTGSCDVAWNGSRATPISTAQYGQDIAAIRARGGDVIASFGGYSADHEAREIADSCRSVPAIATAFEHVISTYDLHRIDLDVEDNSLSNHAGIVRRNQALALVQRWARAQHRTVQISYTLPTSTSGLESDALAVLADAQREHVRVDVVNIMTFDYYDGQPHNMVTDAEHAATALTGQLGVLWHHPPGSLWGRVGVTQMIGIDDFGPAETFYPSQAAAFRDWAVRRGIDTISFWALQRDHGGCVGTPGMDTCSGVAQSTWQFTRALA